MPWRRGTVFVGLAVTVITLASCGGHNSASTTTSTGTPARPAVITSAAPPGWVPFAYQDAVVSVPSSWVVDLFDCSGIAGLGVVFLDNCSDSPGGTPAGSSVATNWIEFSPLPHPPSFMAVIPLCW